MEFTEMSALDWIVDQNNQSQYNQPNPEKESNGLMDENGDGDKKCVICMLTDDELYLLPCKQCNHEMIEIKKYIHKTCFEKYNNPNTQVYEYNQLIPTEKCPFCQANSDYLDTYEQILWIPTLKVIFEDSMPILNIIISFYLTYTLYIPNEIKWIDHFLYRFIALGIFNYVLHNYLFALCQTINNFIPNTIRSIRYNDKVIIKENIINWKI